MGILRRGYTRGLSIVLLVTIITAVNTITVQAATVDDLRAYLGMTVEVRKPTMITVHGSAQEQLKEDSEASKKSSNALELEQSKSNLVKLEVSYEQGLQGDKAATELVMIMQSIRDTKGKVVELGKISGILNNVDITALISNSEVSDIDKAVKEKFGTYRFNIGDVGDMAISPANNFLSLETPYGYKIKTDGTHEQKNTSIDLEIPIGSNVISQWNGKIAYIEADKTGNYSVVTVFHGQGLYTVYHHIITGEIYVGKIVVQGDIIGTVGDTKQAEGDKSNHIKYQVLIDGSYVNPLLVLGDKSRTMYEDWLKGNRDIYTVEVGEEFYYTRSISKSNPNLSVIEHNTIKGAAEIKGNYALPDPGVVE